MPAAPKRSQPASERVTASRMKHSSIVSANPKSIAIAADPQRRDEAAEQLDRRIGDGVDDLGGHEAGALRAPLAVEERDPVEDQPARAARRHRAEQRELRIACDRVWSDMPRSTDYGCAKGTDSGSACATAPSPDTATFSGESRKTLLVTRSMRP